MATRDLKNDVLPAASLHPAATTDGTRTGAAVDLAGYNSATVQVNVGAWTDGTHTPSLTECDTVGGSYTAVAAGDLIGSFTAISGTGQQNAIQSVGYKGTKQFLKAKLVTTGSTTGAVVGMSVLKGHPTNLPAA